MEEYNLIVIGGGPAGYTGAIRAAKKGLKVALIEKQDVGGTCLNRGCIPTKALLHSGNLFASRESWESEGIVVSDISYDESKVYERKERIVSTLRTGIEGLLKANKIDLIKGEAKFIDKNNVKVGDTVYTSQYFLICTGSSPIVLPIPGGETALTSDDVLSKPVVGDVIAIIGGGVIGIELAQYYSSICKNVTIIEGMERILPMFSKEISMQVASVLKRNGVTIYTDAKVTALNGGGVAFMTLNGHGAVSADAVICAVGRKANIAGLGLEDIGVKYARYIDVDDTFKTSVDNIYACGDAVGKIQLAHFAASSALVAVGNIIGEKEDINLGVVPSCLYTSPEVATVGVLEGEGFKFGKIMLGANGRSMIEGYNRGYVKLAVDANDVVKGAEIFGAFATELISELSLAVSCGLKAQDVIKTIHPHPSVNEGIHSVAEDIFGLATDKR